MKPLSAPSCGCTVDDQGNARQHDVGCKEPFVYEGEIYRCTDCSVYMHKHCMQKHFAMSSLTDLAPTVKFLKASLRKNGLDDSGNPLVKP